MIRFQNIYCSHCRKCVGFKIEDGEGPGPIYCLDCEEAVRKECDERAERAEAYHVGSRVA